MLLKVAFLACWPNISKYVGEHCVDVSQPAENRRGGKQRQAVIEINVNCIDI